MYGKLNGIKRSVMVAALALSASLVLPVSAQAGFKTVTVEAEGYNRQNAINNALRKAVEQAGGVKLTSMSKMQNYQLIMDTVVATSTGVVKSYNVEKDADKQCLAKALCSVKITAEVSDQNLYDSVEAARLLFEQKGKPSILVMISEQNAGSQQAAAWWEGGNKSVGLDIVENALMKRWRDYGFRFVDRQALSGKFSVADPATSQVKEIAADAGADIVVLGRAVAVDSSNDLMKETGWHNSSAQLSMRLLYVDNGEIIASETASAKANNTSGETAGKMALERALQKASDGMFTSIMGQWQADSSGPQRLEVTASGFKKSRDFRKFMKVISSKIDAVKQVNQRGYKKGSAKFEVMFLGSAFDFGEALESQSFPGFGIELDEVTGNTLTFTVTK